MHALENAVAGNKPPTREPKHITEKINIFPGKFVLLADK